MRFDRGAGHPSCQLLAFAALALHAQDLPNPVTSGDHFDISGNVLDAVTAKPVPRAQISLEPQGPGGSVRTALTDISGNFLFRQVVLGIYALSASKNGYTAGVDAYHKVILVSGTQPGQYTLKLQPQAVLSGTVSDQEGNPVAGAAVVLLRPEIVEGHMRLQALQTKETDDRGAFRFPGLGNGRYYACALVQPTAYDRQNGVGYPPTFFPNASDISAAQAIALKPGEDRTVNIDDEYADAFHVRGKITPSATQPRVSLRYADPMVAAISLPLEARIDLRSGAFDIPSVPDGDYILEAEGEGAHPLRAERRITVGDKDLEDADLHLEAASERSTKGTVHVDGDTAAASVVSEIGLTNSGSGASGVVDEAGNFEIPAGPGNYRLIGVLKPTALSNNWYIQSATQSGQDVLHGSVMVGDSGTGDPIQVAVSPKGATIEATVTWPDTGPRPAARITVLDPHGEEMLVVAEAKVVAPNPPATTRPMLIGNLAPGSYVVYAWPEPVEVEYASPMALRPYEAFAVPVTIEEGAQVPVALKLAQ